MAEPAGQPNSTALPWWVRASRVGWKVLLYIWGTLIVGIVTGTIANLNTTADTPLSHLFIIHLAMTWPLPVFSGLGTLIVFTGLFWLGSRGRPPTPQHALSEHDRVYTLKRLRFQYEQMLAQSLQGVVQMELGLASRSAAVQNVASLSLRLPDQPEQPLSPHTSIVQAYELAQQELLILGEPGAGKSTQLLKLAYHLVEQAEHDATQPLPVLLPLSSWATAHPPLHDWLVEQVALLYNVQKGLSQQWLQGEQLLPLLDGLDEVEASQRAACITAINTYHHEHLQSLVVCSRTSEYEAAATQQRLALHSAVVVQPLSPEQVDAHLEHLGQPLVALRTTIQKNPVLQELATTPLMVQVLVLTYHGVSIQALSQKEAQLREQIWTDYVKRMASHKGDGKRYPLKQTRAWLRFLAQQMRGHNQTIFFLERLQPDWLPKKPRTVYRWSTGLVFGLGGGLLFGLFAGLFAGLAYGLFVGLFAGLAYGLFVGLFGRLVYGLLSKIKPVEALTWSRSGLFVGLLAGLIGGLGGGLFYEMGGGLGGGLLFGLAGGLAYGLLAGLVYGLVYGLLSKIKPVEALTWSRSGLFYRLLAELAGLFVGLLAGLVYGLVYGLLFGLAGGLFSGLFVGLLGRLVYGLLSEIKPVEALTWSRSGLLAGLFAGLFVGLLFGLFAGLVAGLLAGLIYGLVTGLLAGLIYGLVFGFSGQQLTEHLILSPNEGIRRSITNGLIGGLIGGLGGGLGGGLLFGLAGGLFYGLLFGLLFGQISGLSAAVQHYTLRFWLARTHTFPWKAVPFLEDATARILLRRVGGGYSFPHRLLLDYFADLDAHVSPTSTAVPPPPSLTP